MWRVKYWKLKISLKYRKWRKFLQSWYKLRNIVAWKKACFKTKRMWKSQKQLTKVFGNNSKGKAKIDVFGIDLKSRSLISKKFIEQNKESRNRGQII